MTSHTQHHQHHQFRAAGETFNAQIEFNLRVQRMTFPIIVSLAIITNLLLTIYGGLATLTGIFILFGFVTFVQIYYEIAIRSGVVIDDGAKIDSGDPHLKRPFFDNVLPFIGVWILWWFASASIHYTRKVFAHGTIIQILLILFVMMFVFVRFILRLGFDNIGLIIFRLILRIISVTLMFLPSRDWAPQHVLWFGTNLRVCAFFVMIVLFNVLIPNHRDRCADNIVLTTWILITPMRISFFVMPLVFGVIFFSQTRMRRNNFDTLNTNNDVEAQRPKETAAQQTRTATSSHMVVTTTQSTTTTALTTTSSAPLPTQPNTLKPSISTASLSASISRAANSNASASASSSVYKRTQPLTAVSTTTTSTPFVPTQPPQISSTVVQQPTRKQTDTEVKEV